MKIVVRSVGFGHWKVELATKSHAVPLGTVEIAKDGSFPATAPDGRKLDGRHPQRLQDAARDLCASEIGGDEARGLTVLLPFADGSGP